MPSSRSFPAPLVAVLALLSLAGCNGASFTKLFTTDHFEYYVEEGLDPPCDGTDQWLERYYRANATFLGVELPPGERIEFYLARSTETLGCAEHQTGCAPGTTVRSLFPVEAHEIVHANAFLLGEPPGLFQEGLAVSLGCTDPSDIRGPIDMSDPIELLVETGAFHDWLGEHGYGVYAASASFVRYLIDEFGSSRFLSFYAHAPHNGSLDEIEAMFLVTMGKSLDVAFADWRAKPPPYFADLCLRLMECDPSTPALVGGDTEVTLGCGQLGGLLSNREAIRRFEVPSQRIFHLITEPDPAAPSAVSQVSFHRCSGGNAIGYSGLTAGLLFADGQLSIDPARPGAAFAMDVPPGEYVAWFRGGSDARLRLAAEERQTPMRETCQPAEEPLALDDDHQTTLSSRWADQPCHGPWCPGQSWYVSIGEKGGAMEAQAIVVNDQASLSPAEIYLCAEPCPAGTSRREVLTLDTQDSIATRSQQVFPPGAVLHLGAPAAPSAGHFALRLRVAPE